MPRCWCGTCSGGWARSCPGRAVRWRSTCSRTSAGIGVALEDQARIFEPFERAVSSRHYGGFGLGLWIVRQIVESMGGGIRVESAPGQGSTFRVELEREEASRGWAAHEEAARAH